jgi:hypothetical protein
MTAANAAMLKRCSIAPLLCDLSWSALMPHHAIRELIASLGRKLIPVAPKVSIYFLGLSPSTDRMMNLRQQQCL